MTNPANAMRMLITYAITIPLAILVGYLLTDPLDYGTLGFFGLVFLLILSPIFIKWHYPILVFGLGCPMVCFFLVGRPPLWQVVTLLSLGIAVVERTISNRRFIGVPMATWPFLYIAAMTYLTAKLTGGIGLHQLGGDGGGGKKYLQILIGIASYFALTSRYIPKERRVLYIGLYFLSGISGSIGDLAAVLGGPFHAFNLLFPSAIGYGDVSVGTTRLSTLAGLFGGLSGYMVVRYGLRGVFLSNHWWRVPAFLLLFPFIMLGGFRNALLGALFVYTTMFFLEGLHRTKLLPVLLLVGCLFSPVLGFFSDHLPYTFQRSMSFLPLKWDEDVLMDANGSTEWRKTLWASLYPQVPQYLLLGKGYNMNAEDFQNIGNGAFANLGNEIDPAQQALAISGDYHSGPLSTLIPFGIWGAIGMLWLMAVALFVAYRNFRYGDPDLKVFNAYLLANTLWAIVGFFFIFGAFSANVADFAKMIGFSIALNWGVCRPPPKPVYNPHFKPAAIPAPQLV
jgi:hypothetical protein